MAEQNCCPECGCELPVDSPAGLCPDCLLKAGLDSEDHAPTIDAPGPPAPGGRFEPPKPNELADKFPQLDILDLIGQGGMGAVYKARQKSLDRLVALKIINPMVGDDPDFAERFAREAKALARLNHPNIVGVHDFGQTDGLFYFVMEYVDGANLRQLIQSRELQPEQALAIVPQICAALQFAHDEGIVHRDVKPENILVDSRGRVKIADYGLAKLLGKTAANELTLTGTHQVMGTPRYMAPEQMEGSQNVDHRADIYSLGVVFYELLTGELPLGRFDLPSERAGTDSRLDDVVLRALAKEPQRRYQHASELKTEVERLSDPQLPAARVADHAEAMAEAIPVTAGAPPVQGARRDARSMQSMNSHVTILGVVYIAFGCLGLLAALIVLVAVTGGGIISQDTEAMFVTSIVGPAIAGFLTLLSLPGFIAGFGIIKHKSWARMLVLILAVFQLCNVPFGTILGIYSFWVLLHKESTQLFATVAVK